MSLEFEKSLVFFFLKVLYCFQHFNILYLLTLRIVIIRECQNTDHGPFETHYEQMVHYGLLWVHCVRLVLS